MDEEKKKRFEEVKKTIKSVVIPHKNGLKVSFLCSDYYELEGESLPFKQFGYKCIKTFLEAMDDAIYVKSDGDEHLVFSVKDDSTGHIQEMVHSQKKKKKRRKGCFSFQKKSTPNRSRIIRTVPNWENEGNNEKEEEWDEEDEEEEEEEEGEIAENDEDSVPLILGDFRPPQPRSLTDWLISDKERHSSGNESTGSGGRIKDFSSPKKLTNGNVNLDYNLVVEYAEEAEEDQDWKDAVHWWTEAIKRSSNIFEEGEAYTNRAVCYEKWQRYDNMLKDAIKIMDTFFLRRKLGWYLKGRALMGLDRIDEALVAFTEAQQFPVRCHFIVESIDALINAHFIKFGYTDEEIDLLKDKPGSHKASGLDTLSECEKILMQRKRKAVESGELLPSNPFYYRGLFVNNLAPDCDVDKVRKLFAIEEDYESDRLFCKLLRNDDCFRAFISYRNWRSARKALGKLLYFYRCYFLLLFLSCLLLYLQV